MSMKCKHGNEYCCGLCEVEEQPKCKHGNPYYCGLCLVETGDGRVPAIGSEAGDGPSAVSESLGDTVMRAMEKAANQGRCPEDLRYLLVACINALERGQRPPFRVVVSTMADCAVRRKQWACRHCRARADRICDIPHEDSCRLLEKGVTR